MHLTQCMFCDDKFKDFESLFGHMKAEEHLKPPQDREEWDQSQFYFPTYENDNFLCLIEEDEEEDSVPVIPQDIQVQESILFHEEFRKQLVPKHHHHKK